MDCDKKVQRALEKLPGVDHVEVLLWVEKAVIQHDPKLVTRNLLKTNVEMVRSHARGRDLRAGEPERFEALTHKGIRAVIDGRTVEIDFPANLLTALKDLVGLSRAAFGLILPIVAASFKTIPDTGMLANSSRLIRQN